MLWKVMFVALAAIAVAVWYPPWRWYALGWAVPLGLFLLLSVALRIHELRHREADEDEDEGTEILQDLREAAGWLFQLWP